MPILELKSYLAIPFLAAGITAVLLMFDLMGRPERKTSPDALRRGHKAAGYLFVVLLGILSYLCLAYVEALGDRMSHRAVLHSVLALGLIGVLVIKILIARFYRGLLRLVPALGITAFVLAFVVFFTSAGYFFLREAGVHGADETATAQGTSAYVSGLEGDAARGERVYADMCGACHNADSEDWLIGPGLKGVLGKERLPESGRPATLENIRSQILSPVGTMPAITSLSDQQMADLLAYMEGL
jgi:cytochrome c553